MNLCLIFAVHLAVKSTIDLTIGAKIVHYRGDFRVFVFGEHQLLADQFGWQL